MDLVDLVNAARAGDRTAFGAIVRRFQDMAFGGAYAWLGEAEDARDAAQDAFVEAWESLDRLREPAAFPGWFQRIVRKHADRHQRNRRPVLPHYELESLPSSLPDPLQLAERDELRGGVQAGIASLPESQRLPLTLFHLDGYSQKEVAAFLELPVSTVKKRIFDARRVLQERMSHMVKETLEEARPSRDDDFARRVEYFVAVKDGDVGATARLLDEDASLLTLKKDWEFSPDDVIPRNAEAATWAAMTNDVPLLTLLLDRGADVETPRDGGEGLLHAAVMADAHEVMRLLLQRGADVERAKGWQTPLHRAVMRDDRVAVDILLEAGADLEANDQRGRTPADWAALKGRDVLLRYLREKGALKPSLPLRTRRLSRREETGRTVPSGETVLDRFFDAAGKPLDGSRDPERVPLLVSIDAPRTPILETGIKVIDLFAPIRRGGHAALSGGYGVGKAVVSAQLARNLAAEFDARIVFVASPPEKPGFDFREWRTMLTDGRLLAEHTTYVLARADDDASCREAAETGAGMAEAFRQQGCEVLLIIDSRIAQAPGVLPFLRTCTSITPQASVTTLYLASMPYGVAGGALSFVDTAIRLDWNRAHAGLYPAVNPIHSSSRLLQEDLLDPAHVETVERATESLGWYYEHGKSGPVGRAIPKPGSLWGHDADADDHEVTQRLMTRSRRLDQFLTQPFHMTELWQGEPGETVPLSESLDGCRRILDGELDDVPEDAFYMIGAVEQAAEKAQRL